MPSPAPRKTPERRSPQLEPLKEIIDGWLRADLDAPRKQRHTAKRIHDRLAVERGAADVSYSAVRDYVARRRPEIRIEEGRGPAKVFVPQHHPPGQDAEVDFGELWVRLAGVMTKCYLFVFRLSYSGKAVHRVFATCGQEAFLEGHVHAFTVLGGVPAGQVRYDNLNSAVWKVLLRGRARAENPRWTTFRSHYRGSRRFTACPGSRARTRKAAWKARSVTSAATTWSRSPRSTCLDELNARLAEAEEAEDRPPDRGPDPHHRAGLRRRAAAADPAAGRPVRDRAAADPAGRPV